LLQVEKEVLLTRDKRERRQSRGAATRDQKLEGVIPANRIDSQGQSSKMRAPRMNEDLALAMAAWERSLSGAGPWNGIARVETSGLVPMSRRFIAILRRFSTKLRNNLHDSIVGEVLGFEIPLVEPSSTSVRLTSVEFDVHFPPVKDLVRTKRML
jgi:hypothetical protein